jgi:hypothetical protein
MAYQVRVIGKFKTRICRHSFFRIILESFDITPKHVLIPADDSGQYSIRINCILTDNHTGRRNHEIHWWHNNKRLGSHSNRHARIIKNFTQHSFISTLFYTGKSANIAGNYMCESDPLRRLISVQLQTNKCSSMKKKKFFFRI